MNEADHEPLFTHTIASHEPANMSLRTNWLHGPINPIKTMFPVYRQKNGIYTPTKGRA